MKTLTEWNVEATTRYLTDPEFHARSYMAAGLTVAVLEADGHPIAEDQRAVIVQAVVFGLLMAELSTEDLVAGGMTAEQSVKSMISSARAMGMDVVAKSMTTIDFEAVPE